MPRFHASLSAASQPASCLDCHANSRPVTLLTTANAALPQGMTFDHTAAENLGECASCHTSTASWAGGRFHRQGTPAPASCTTCHEARRPTSTTGWQSSTYTRSPFDDVGAGATSHGAGEDGAVCHSASTSTWGGGHFPHGRAPWRR